MTKKEARDIAENPHYRQHALDCGINMTGKLALALEDSTGMLLMIDIARPDNREVIIPAGIILDCQLIEHAARYGVDYTIVYFGTAKVRD